MLTICFGSKYSFAFLTGYLFAFRKERKDNWQPAVFVIIAIYTLVTMGVMYLLYIIISSTIIGLLLSNKLELLNNKILLFFGGISYELYLLHEYIGFEIIHRFDLVGWHNECNLVIPFAVVVLLSYLVNKASNKVVYPYLKKVEQFIWPG